MDKIIITEDDLYDEEPEDFECPYDGAPGILADAVVCTECSTPHHKECWEENGGCTTFGCQESPELRGNPSTPTPPTQTDSNNEEEGDWWSGCLFWIFIIGIKIFILSTCDG